MNPNTSGHPHSRWQRMKRKGKPWEQRRPSPQRDTARGSVCLYMCVYMFCIQCWVIAGLARQIETSFWGGQLEGHKGASTEHALKSTGRELVVMTGHIQERWWRNISRCQIFTPSLTYVSPGMFDDTNEKILVAHYMTVSRIHSFSSLNVAV